MIWSFICATGLVIALMLPVRFYQNIAYPTYGLSLLLLLLALFVGQEVNGAKSWLRIGSIQLQVSEMAKVGTLLAVSMLLSNKRPGAKDLRISALVCVIVLIPIILILMQNDAGTALMYICTLPFLLYWSGIPLSHILILIAPALTSYLTIVYLPAAIAFAIIFIIILFLRKANSTLALIVGVVTNVEPYSP